MIGNPREKTLSESSKVGTTETNNETTSHIISIPDRKAYDKLTYDDVYEYQAPPEKGVKDYARDFAREQCYTSCGGKCLWKFAKSKIPILGWLISYNIKKDLLEDFIAGITVGIMQVPQSMAYAFLANIGAIYGLYTSLFPVLVYCVMGTSKHVSVGMYAIVCLMVGKVVTSYSDPDVPGDDIAVATVIAFFLGCVQLGLGLLRLGTLTVYMSEILISGYTCASAFFVLTSQIPFILGYLVTQYGGPLSFFYTWIEIFQKIHLFNWVNFVISVIAMVILFLNKQYLSPWVQKKIKCPFPMDLVLIVITTCISYALKLQTDYGVLAIGKIPSDLPKPSLPHVHRIKSIAADSVSIALVAITVNLSMAKVFAKKYNYEVDTNQELVAHGVSNLFGSFMSCAPSAVSLSRSSVMSAYCKTQLAAVFASGLLLIVIFWLTFTLTELPQCILACIIIIALKNMIMQITDLKKAWKLSKPDALVWIVSFVATILLDVDNGLLVSIGFSLLLVLTRTHLSSVRILGQVSTTDIYEDVKIFKATHETEHIKVIQFAGPMYFANREHFRDEVYKIMSSPKQIEKQKKKNPDFVMSVKYIVLDCSCWAYIDGSAIEALGQIIKEYAAFDIKFLLVACNEDLFEVLKRSDLYPKIKSDIYPTIHDAVIAKTEEGIHNSNKEGEASSPALAYDNSTFDFLSEHKF